MWLIIGIVLATVAMIWSNHKLTMTIIEDIEKQTDYIIKQNEEFIEQHNKEIENIIKNRR